MQGYQYNFNGYGIRTRTAHPPQVLNPAKAGQRSLRGGLEGSRQANTSNSGPQESLRRFPKRHRCATHLPRGTSTAHPGHLPARTQRTPQHSLAAQHPESGEQQGHLPSVRLHGDGPSRGDKGKHHGERP